MVSWGGGSLAAARRAGRHGVGFFAQKGDPALGEAYEQAAREAGHEPGMCLLPPVDAPTTVFVAEDLDKAWDELGPYLMHDVLSYAEWNEGNVDTASLSFVKTAEELRAENRSHRIYTVDEAIAAVRAGMPLGLHPAHRRAAARDRLALLADRRRQGDAGRQLGSRTGCSITSCGGLA